MAEKTTIARPYAQAVFELAQERKELPRWSEMLHLAAAVVSDERVGALVGDPRVSKAQLAALIVDVGGERFTQEARHFVQLLAENGRLSVLPEIAAHYEDYRADAERTVEAQVISAFAIDEAQQKQVAAALKKRLGREVTVSCEVDESLLGGAIIRAGDLVIDGSVLGQLAKLKVALAR